MDTLKLSTFVLVVSLVFPIFGYGLTNFLGTPINYNLSVDPNLLIQANILFGEGESHNITFGSYAEYNFNNSKDTRCYWHRIGEATVGSMDIMEFWFQGIVSTFLDFWQRTFVYLDKIYNPKTGALGLGSEYPRYIDNSTIVNNFDNSYNWTRFNLQSSGYIVLITPVSGGNNITESVYTNGTITVTLVKSLQESEEINFMQFVSWYMGLLLGENSFGLPSFFSWITRIFGVLTILSIVLLAKELTKV